MYLRNAAFYCAETPHRYYSLPFFLNLHLPSNLASELHFIIRCLRNRLVIRRSLDKIRKWLRYDSSLIASYL